MVGAEPEEVRRYLAELGMGAKLIERVEGVLDPIMQLLPDEPKFIFVSEYRDSGGNRGYESLWVLTPTVVSEATAFVTSKAFDCCRTASGLTRIIVDRES